MILEYTGTTIGGLRDQISYPRSDKENCHIGIFINGAYELSPDDLSSVLERVNSCSELILADGGANHFHRFTHECAAAQLGLRVKPVALLGDLDSVTKATEEFIGGVYPECDTIHCRRDKDFTDLELALGLCNIAKVARITIFFGTGGRIDHMLTNIFCLLRNPWRGKASIYHSPREEIHVIKYESSSFGEGEMTPLPLYKRTSGLAIRTLGFSELGETLLALARLKETPYPHTYEKEGQRLFTIPPGGSVSFPTQIAQTISLIPLGGSVKGVSSTGLHWNLDGNLKLSKQFVGVSNIATGNEVSLAVEEGYLLCAINDLVDHDMYEKVR